MSWNAGYGKTTCRRSFKVPIERFTYRAAGINHLTWFTDMKIDGKDVYPKLHDKLKESGFDKKNLFQSSYMTYMVYIRRPVIVMWESFFRIT